MIPRGNYAVALLLFVAAGSPASAHEVTVHRGADVKTAFGPTAPAGATVVARGAAINPRTAAGQGIVAARTGSAVPIVAGERLWLVDTAADRLTVCTLRNTADVGREVIRCRHRRLPR